MSNALQHNMAVAYAKPCRKMALPPPPHLQVDFRCLMKEEQMSKQANKITSNDFIPLILHNPLNYMMQVFHQFFLIFFYLMKLFIESTQHTTS